MMAVGESPCSINGVISMVIRSFAGCSVYIRRVFIELLLEFDHFIVGHENVEIASVLAHLVAHMRVGYI